MMLQGARCLMMGPSRRSPSCAKKSANKNAEEASLVLPIDGDSIKVLRPLRPNLIFDTAL